jgi:hypothetical protein
VAELLVLPILINVASEAISSLVGSLINRIRHDRGEPALELELVESIGTDGERILVARVRRSPQ